jgi:hypothetical protein
VSRRNRQIRTEELETPEGAASPIEERSEGLTIAEAVDVYLNAKKEIDRDRVERARVLTPAASHWLAAWEAGRDAAADAFEGGTPADDLGMLQPPVDFWGCRDCWRKGRDAAREVLKG